VAKNMASATSFAPRDSRSDPPGLRSHEPSGSQIGSKPPQPMPYAKGGGVPERKIGFEAMEASAKLRKSSIDCMSAASFEAARSEQLRLPAEGPHKGASRPGAIEHWTVEQWTILRLRSTSLLSILHTDPLLQFPMLQGAKRLPGPRHPQPEGVEGKER
jgi:hypothetical protein